jgi:hypothetical protein
MIGGNVQIARLLLGEADRMALAETSERLDG